MSQPAGIRILPLDYGDPIDFLALAKLHDAAWRTDYRGTVRYIYDEKFFRWLLDGDDWIGVVAVGDDGLLVGSVFSFMRLIRCGSECVKAAYSTGLAVAPEQRGTGLGRELYEAMRQRVFEERRRSIGVAMFQAGHGGLPTVASGIRRAGKMDALVLHQGSIWSRRLVYRQSHASTGELLRASRIDYGLTSKAVDDRGGTILGSRHLACLLARGSSIEFDASESFARMYMNARTTRAGMLAYNVGSPDECAVTYSLIGAAIDSMHLGTIAQLQTLHSISSARDTLLAAIAEFCRSMHEHGCVAATLVDHGYLPQPVLRSLDFNPSEDELIVSLRGLPADLEPFREMKPPYLLDFI